MLFALIFQRAQRARTFDISAQRNLWLQSALPSFAIVCDYMETALFAIVCNHMETSLYEFGQYCWEILESDTLLRNFVTFYGECHYIWYR